MLRPLTALRFAAALLVFPWHAAASRSIAMEFSLGYAGVTFFYVLSGFILTYNYEALFAERLTYDLVRAFWIARFARVYPVHLFTMGITLAVLAAMGGDHWSVAWPERLREIGAQIVLLQSWFPSENIHFGINGPAWSISVEFFFYALFPLLLILLRRTFQRASASMLLIFAACLWLGFTLFIAPVRAQFDQWNLYVFPPVRLIDFTLGILLAMAFSRRAYGSRVRVDATVIECAALSALGAAIICTAYLPQSLRFSAAILPFAMAVIYVFATGEGAFSRLLAFAPLVRLGEASYAFYLVHLDVIHIVEHALGPHRRLVACMLSLFIAGIISLAVFAHIEAPMRHYIRRLADRMQAHTLRACVVAEFRGEASCARSIES